MSRALFGINRPTVGLLNVGVEEIKGQEEVKEAGRLIREAGLDTIDYYGFVEGDEAPVLARHHRRDIADIGTDRRQPRRHRWRNLTRR